MSNIGNKILAGYFAFPKRQGEYLIQLLKQKEGKTAWLDTTCGEGKILKQLHDGLCTEKTEIETYGVEVDRERAAKANEILDNVMNCPIESMVIQNDAFGFIFLNPPYDHTLKGINDDTKTQRKEFIELQRATRYLQPGGVLVYVIPSYRFADKQIARFLATHYEQTGIMRFTDEDYDDFKQCIFIGYKKEDVVKTTNKKMMDFLLQMSSETFIDENVNPITDFIGQTVWSIPVAKPIKTFYTRLESKKAYYDGIRNSAGFEAFMNRTKPKELEIGGNPILPLNSGLMALLLASGAVNGLIGKGEHLHLVQGMEVVGKKTEKEEEVSAKGHVTTKTIETTTRTVSVKIFTPNGTIKKLM